MCERDSPASSEASEEGGTGTPSVRAEILLQPREVSGGAEIPLLPMGGPHTGGRVHMREDADAWEAHTGAGEGCEESSP